MNIRIKYIHQKIFFICLLPLYANNPIFYIFFDEQSIELGPGTLLFDPATADQGRKERKYGLKINVGICDKYKVFYRNTRTPQKHQKTL